MLALDRGTMLGGCRIEEPIGRGGMGVVYRAVQVELGRDVAVKVIAPDRVGDADARRRFLREVRAGAAVEHPNVVPVHGAGTDGDCAYVVMRYVPGTDLRTLVRVEGPLAPERAGVVAECLGDALDALHAAGYVHRDVKPGNVLIDEQGHVYLSDFGIARELLGTATHTEPGRWVGTIDFAAPEQIRGDPVDARADVYALGAVVFFMLTGQVPFERPTDEARLWAQLADAPPRPSALRPELAAGVDAVVLRALAKHPAERQPSAGALGRDVRAAVTGEPTADAATPGPARRRRTAIGAAATAAAVIAAVVAALALPRGEGDRGGAAREPAQSVPAVAAVATPPNGRVTGTAHGVGFRPRGLAVADGAVWVISHGRERIARVDAETLRRTGPQPRIGRGAWSIAADGDQALWVAVPRRGAVLRLDPASGRVTGRIRPPLTPVDVRVGADGCGSRAVPGATSTRIRPTRCSATTGPGTGSSGSRCRSRCRRSRRREAASGSPSTWSGSCSTTTRPAGCDVSRRSRRPPAT